MYRYPGFEIRFHVSTLGSLRREVMAMLPEGPRQSYS